MSVAGVSGSFFSPVIFLWQRTRVISYPNSGRTWLRVMLDDLGIRPRFTHAQSRYRLAALPADFAAGVEEHQHRRVLMLLRDPKDTTCSNYNWVTKKARRWNGEFKPFLRDRNYGFERILAFNVAWLKARDRFNRGFHVETYETLHGDTARSLRRVVEFLNVPGVTDEAIAEAATRNQFDRMKEREVSGELYARHGDRFSTAAAADPDSRKVRRGKVGGYVEDMDDDDIAFCDELLRRYRYHEVLAAALRQ